MSDYVRDDLLHSILKDIGLMRGEMAEQLGALRGETSEKLGMIYGKVDGMEKQLSMGERTMLEHDRRISDLEKYREAHTSQIRMFFLIGSTMAAVAAWFFQYFWPLLSK
ncbi:MAG: hypothetical protein HQL73_09655 [Magnetococcales bacterium]|nr:hypothetical protein [Magnetococcales bacterium]